MSLGSDEINPRLGQAVEVFRELGWDRPSFSLALTLPVGTVKQQEVAVAGLSFGSWSVLEKSGIAESMAPGDSVRMLALFAVRMGVDVERALEIFATPVHDNFDGGLATQVAVLSGRGVAFATEYVIRKFAQYDPSSGMLVDALGVILTLGLEPPDAQVFLHAWALGLACSLEGYNWYGVEDYLLPLDLFRPTFLPLIRRAVTDPALRVELILTTTHRLGWLSREEFIDLVFQRVDATGDSGFAREVFATTALKAADLVPHLQAVTLLLDNSDANLVELLAPLLAATCPDTQIAEDVSLAVPTCEKKTIVAVFKALKKRRTPGDETLDTLVPIINSLASSQDHRSDHQTRKKATELLHHWGIYRTG